MKRSETIKELAAALAKAQGDMAGAKKDSLNPYFKSKYADLASCWEACRKPLTDNGLSVVQDASVDGEKLTVTVETELLHISGEWIKSSMTSPASEDAKDSKTGEVYQRFDPQTIGKVITYLRRYSLSAIVGIAPEDDDGNSAQQQQARQQQKPTNSSNEAMPLLEAAAVRGSSVLEQSWSALTKEQKLAVQAEMPKLKALAKEIDSVATSLDNVTLADLNDKVLAKFLTIPKEHQLRAHMWSMIELFAHNNECTYDPKLKKFVQVEYAPAS